jgi:hypothetical protein
LGFHGRRPCLRTRSVHMYTYPHVYTHMCTCACVYAYIHQHTTHARTYTSTHGRTQTRKHARTYAHTHVTRTGVGTCIRGRLCTCKRVDVCVRVHMYVCTCQRVYVYIHGHVAISVYMCACICAYTSSLYTCTLAHFLFCPQANHVNRVMCGDVLVNTFSSPLCEGNLLTRNLMLKSARGFCALVLGTAHAPCDHSRRKEAWNTPTSHGDPYVYSCTLVYMLRRGMGQGHGPGARVHVYVYTCVNVYVCTCTCVYVSRRVLVHM